MLLCCWDSAVHCTVTQSFGHGIHIHKQLTQGGVLCPDIEFAAFKNQRLRQQGLVPMSLWPCSLLPSSLHMVSVACDM